jgi:hypothetical protein
MTLAFGQHEDRTPTHGYKATRELAAGMIGGPLRRSHSGRIDGTRLGQPQPYATVCAVPNFKRGKVGDH